MKKELTDRGYAWAKVDSQAELDIGTHTADYGFSVVPGPRAVFGPITITGLDPDGAGPRKQEIREAPLRRAIAHQGGAPVLDRRDRLSDAGAARPRRVRRGRDRPRASRPAAARSRRPAHREGRAHAPSTDHARRRPRDRRDQDGPPPRRRLGGPQLPRRPARLRRHASSRASSSTRLRINNLHGPVQPLPEMWLKTHLRQPGFIEARTTGFVRPEFNIFPLLVEVNPPADAPVVGYREVKVPIGVDRTFWKKLYVALDYNLQVENPFAYVKALDPALETVCPLVPRARRAPRLSRQRRAAALGHLPREHLPGGRRHLRRHCDRRARAARGPDVRAHRAWPDLCDSRVRGLSLVVELREGLADRAGELGRRPPRLSAPERAPQPVAAQQAARTQLGHDAQIMYFRGFFSGGPSTNRGFPILGVCPARRRAVPQPRHGRAAGAVQLRSRSAGLQPGELLLARGRLHALGVPERDPRRHLRAALGGLLLRHGRRLAERDRHPLRATSTCRAASAPPTTPPSVRSASTSATASSPSRCSATRTRRPPPTPTPSTASSPRSSESRSPSRSGSGRRTDVDHAPRPSWGVRVSSGREPDAASEPGHAGAARRRRRPRRDPAVRPGGRRRCARPHEHAAGATAPGRSGQPPARHFVPGARADRAHRGHRAFRAHGYGCNDRRSRRTPGARRTGSTHPDRDARSRSLCAAREEGPRW